MPHLTRSLALVPLALLAACGSAPRPVAADAEPERAPRIVRTDDSGPRRLGRVSPPALLAGQPVSWEALHETLVEAAGAVALEEYVLDRLLEDEADRLGIDTSTLNTRRERDLLEQSLSSVSGVSPARLLEELRRTRGLGPVRFEALLRRTAMMRAIVAPRVTITPEQIALATEIRYGEKHRVRLITVGSLVEAQTVLRMLERGDDFAEIAARLSTDTSADRGGLIAPFSAADPSYPAALRDAVRELAPGQWSSAITLTGTYAVAMLVEVLPPEDVPLSTSSPLVEADARTEQERILMTQLARRLLDGGSLNILDPALRTAWNRRGNQ